MNINYDLSSSQVNCINKVLLYRTDGLVGFKWTCSEADQNCSCFRVNATTKDCSVFSMQVFVENTDDDDGDNMGTGDDDTGDDDTGDDDTGDDDTGYPQSTGNLTVFCKLGNRVKVQKNMDKCEFSIAEIAIIGASTGIVFSFKRLDTQLQLKEQHSKTWFISL